jgi:hypothetical protein
MAMTDLIQAVSPDEGFYEKASTFKSETANGVRATTTRYLGELAKHHGVYPEKGEQELWENRWLRQMGVNRLWPEPRREEKVRQFASDWWTVMKLFENEKCPAWPNAANATVEKAFQTSSLQSIFGIFFDTNIQAALLANPVLDRLVTRSVAIDSHTAIHVKMTETSSDATMGEIGEGTSMPQLIIKEAERSIKLRKFGGELLWTYEVVRLMRLDVLALSIQRIATRWDQQKTDFALATMIDGDGGGDGAATTSASATIGTPVYADLITGEFVFPIGYTPDTIVAPKEVLAKILKMSQYQDPLAGVLHQTTGAIPRPLGQDLVRWDSTGKVSTYAATTAVMFDSSKALVEYTEGGIITETERVIKDQWWRNVSSQWVGYGVWDRNAAVLMTGW